MKNKKTAVIAALSLWPTIALPQEGDAIAGGVTFDFGLSSSLRIDDNYNLSTTTGGTTTIFDNRLSFGVSSITAVDALRFTAAGVLRYADVPGGSDSGFEDPSLGLTYTRTVPNSRLNIFARYRKADRDFLDPLLLDVDDFDPDDLIFDPGTIETTEAGVTFETGLQDPIGFALSASMSDRDYTDTTDPDLADSERNSVSATTLLRVSAVTTARMTLAYDTFTADDTEETDRTTESLSFGVAHEVSPSLRLDASVGYTNIETEELLLGVPTTSVEKGVFGALQAVQDAPNGQYIGRIELQRTAEGTRTNLTFGRSLELPRGSLAAGVGVTRGDSGGTDLLASLDYTQQLPRGQGFTASIDRTVTTNSDDDEVLATRLALGYSMPINTVSQFGVTFDYARSEDGGAGSVETIDQGTLVATYTRELTPDWDLSAGYQYRYRDREVGGNADSNSVFLTLDRNFSWRR